MDLKSKLWNDNLHVRLIQFSSPPLIRDVWLIFALILNPVNNFIWMCNLHDKGDRNVFIRDKYDLDLYFVSLRPLPLRLNHQFNH